MTTTLHIDSVSQKDKLCQSLGSCSLPEHTRNIQTSWKNASLISSVCLSSRIFGAGVYQMCCNVEFFKSNALFNRCSIVWRLHYADLCRNFFCLATSLMYVYALALRSKAKDSSVFAALFPLSICFICKIYGSPKNSGKFTGQLNFLCFPI